MSDYNELTPEEQQVLLHKGTEMPFTGPLTDHFEVGGHYVCKQCNTPLYRSEHKFHSNCGWPAFDDEIEGAVKREVDADGYRVGHVFEGEGLTAKNIRHCVNSISMEFVAVD